MRGWLLGIAGVLSVLVVGGCSAVTPAAPPATRPVVSTATPLPPRPTITPIPGRPAIGQEAHLWARNLTQWHLAVDEQAMAAYVSLTNAGDAAGLRQLVEAGRAFPVADETRVLVIDQKWPVVLVRVLEGPQSGKTGWVAFEHVR